PGNTPNATPTTGLPNVLKTEVVNNAGVTTPSVPAVLSGDDRETIYGLTVLNLVKNERANTVYLSPLVGEGERLDESNTAKALDAALARYMDSVDGERQYAMSEFSQVVGPLEDGGKVMGGGVYVTLGEILADPESAGRVAVRGSIYRGRGDAEGNLYRFQRDDTAPDGWKLLDLRQEWSDELK
ncbi:MAG TPA: hypothetical protein VGE04_20150, partial [Chloroflexia bacterium]